MKIPFTRLWTAYGVTALAGDDASVLGGNSWIEATGFIGTRAGWRRLRIHFPIIRCCRWRWRARRSTPERDWASPRSRRANSRGPWRRDILRRACWRREGKLWMGTLEEGMRGSGEAHWNPRAGRGLIACVQGELPAVLGQRKICTCGLKAGRLFSLRCGFTEGFADSDWARKRGPEGPEYRGAVY